MGEVVYGTDFRKHRDRPWPATLEQMATDLLTWLHEQPLAADTAPCEVNPDPIDDSAV